MVTKYIIMVDATIKNCNIWYSNMCGCHIYIDLVMLSIVEITTLYDWSNHRELIPLALHVAFGTISKEIFLTYREKCFFGFNKLY